MNLPRGIRLLIAMAVLVLGLAALALLLTLGESALAIRAHLDNAPVVLQIAWWGSLAVGGLALGGVLWWLLRPRSARSRGSAAVPAPAPTEHQVREALDDAAAQGIDVSAARRELEELVRRRDSGEIHVALFGEISTGKSALVHALLPDAQAISDVRGGTTRELTRYTWRSPGGDVLTLTDMPGTGEIGAALDALASDEATRAHIVVYVTDSDLNRAQHAALQALLALDKPLILVLNKTDRYSEHEVAQLTGRLAEMIAGSRHARLATVSAATRREVLLQLPDGREQAETRQVPARVDALAAALQHLVDDNQVLLDRLRDSATFVLAQRHVDTALAKARRTRADALVDSYATKAVVGAMAAITPGTDLLIQGYLGTQLVRELAALYEVRIGQVDTELLLRLVQQHAARAHTLLLAVAGNTLKAFPGVGTLAGGALHAVAYGIIFHTLGHALTQTLEARGELAPRPVAKAFEENLGEDLETSARRLARVVVERIGNTRNA